MRFTYEVNNSALLTAGWLSPAEGAPVTRGEGVELVLDGQGLAAWKLGVNRQHDL